MVNLNLITQADSLLETFNQGLRYGVEAVAVVAFALVGFKVGGGSIAEPILTLGLPSCMALLWGAFVSPNAAARLEDPKRARLEGVVFALAALALAWTISPWIAAPFALIALLNFLLMVVLGQR